MTDDPHPQQPSHGAEARERYQPSRTNVIVATLLVLIPVAGIVLFPGFGGRDAARETPPGTEAATASELRIQTVPDGARVFVDGVLVGMAPAWEGLVEVGVHWVEVVDPTETVVLDTMVWVIAGTSAVVSAGEPESAGETTPDPVALGPSEAEPAETTGDLRVSSTPSGAVVQIDGRRAGTTPLALGGLSPGAYTVTVARSGYEPVRRQMGVRAGGVFEASVDLRPLAAAPQPAEAPRRADPPLEPKRADPPSPRRAATAPGVVEVLVRPWGRIAIDGVTHMAETDVVYRAALPAGVHHVEVTHPELGSRTRSVTVSPGGRVRVEIDLARGS